MPGLVLAFILDLAIGDPVYRWHPVRLMGRAIEKGEAFLRGHMASEKTGGALLALTLPLTVFILAGAAVFFLGRIHWALGWTANMLGIYAALSVRDLQNEGLRICASLGRKDISGARSDLARIVGRDTQHLDEREILRASVETVAESLVDGIIAPLLYAALGGAPLALAYKAVNTLDSMIGHKNERYRNFGRVAAKQDELWNWIPARLSCPMIGLAAYFVTGRIRQAFASGWRYGVLPHYGNSAIPEAAAAGALGLRLGGVNTYEGRSAEKPFLGVSEKDFERDDLRKMLKLMILASCFSLLGVVFIKAGIDLFCSYWRA